METLAELWEEMRSVDGARSLARSVGKEQITALHRASPTLDALTVAWALGVETITLTGLALLPYGALWAVCAVAQPVILFHWIMVGHDLCTHRRWGGPTISWLLSMVLAIPRFTLPTQYLHMHQLHHRYIGTELDGERYKQGLSTRWRRWFFLTLPGALLAPRMVNRVGEPLPEPLPGRARRIAVERWVLRAYLVALLIGCVVWPKVFLFGHLLPVALLGPPLNTLRIVLEHAEADDDNPLFLGTDYRSGWLIRAVTLVNAGDGHIVHHQYPNMPWYRVPAFIRLMRPYLLAAGVTERRSITGILWGWLVRGYPHRQVWPTTPDEPVSS